MFTLFALKPLTNQLQRVPRTTFKLTSCIQTLAAATSFAVQVSVRKPSNTPIAAAHPVARNTRQNRATCCVLEVTPGHMKIQKIWIVHIRIIGDIFHELCFSGTGPDCAVVHTTIRCQTIVVDLTVRFFEARYKIVGHVVGFAGEIVVFEFGVGYRAFVAVVEVSAVAVQLVDWLASPVA